MEDLILKVLLVQPPIQNTCQFELRIRAYIGIEHRLSADKDDKQSIPFASHPANTSSRLAVILRMEKFKAWKPCCFPG